MAALLRGNLTVTELVLRGNTITDEGARALAAVLAGPCALRAIDLRANYIGKAGLRALAEALERCVCVFTVCVCVCVNYLCAVFACAFDLPVVVWCLSCELFRRLIHAYN